MTSRCAVLLVPGDLGSPAAPAGVDAEAYGQAMIADVAEVLHDLSGVDSVAVCSVGQETALRSLVWADVAVVGVAAADVRTAVQVAAARGYPAAVVVAADIPDLPQMILAKMFQALAAAPVAIAPAHGGGAVAFGVTLPAPSWLSGWLARADFDALSVIDEARACAARLDDVRVTPGWHRMRSAADVDRLDRGLEGWDSTRALLAAVRAPGEG